MAPINTSYEQRYVYVTRSSNMAVLRVVDDFLYRTYWKTFLSAKVEVDNPPMYLRIEQVPPETILVDQYAQLIPEMPIVTLEVAGERINISDKIVANTPNTEVPGLYRIDYRINVPPEASAPIWASYVSIQQRPVLRKAAANWVRDGYVIQTLNRLVMEPQFMEALHAAGEPLYGFMEANQHPSIRSGDLSKYGGIQAWGAAGAIGEGSNGIFITGERLPQGSVVVYQRRMLQLREPVWPDPWGAAEHMNVATHERSDSGYTVGSVVRSGEASYICIKDAGRGVSLSDTTHWAGGHLYKFAVLNGDASFELPRGILPVGNGGVEHIWATVDDQGYSFWVDLLNVRSLGAYRGYYDRKSYADYGPGDIVSFIVDGSARLFRRKATDIQPTETLAYPPNHHLNPAWEEIYCHFDWETSPLLSDYSVIPHTNATNAIMSQTWSVSEEMCQAYGNMMGIPPEIMKECGAKWSALLFALITRTRNTYEGLRICFRAVGLDVENLHLSRPSIAYHCKPEGEAEELVSDIYRQHENLRKLLSHIDTLRPEGVAEAKDGNLRYVTESTEGAAANEVNVAIQQYSESAGWVTRYRFEKVETAANLNNRYYEGDLNVLARLAEDAVKDLGDGHSWIKESAWAGAPSKLAAVCLRYEVPIYIWLTLKIRVYSETKMEMQGFAYSGVSDGQACGARNTLRLFPSFVFDRAAHDFITVETGVFRQENNAWSEIPPTRVEENGTKIYEFTGMQYPLRIRAINADGLEFARYWQSTGTRGLLGSIDSPSTVNDVPFVNDSHFHNVTDPDITDESDLMLANGDVGVTAVYALKSLAPLAVEALRWSYVLENEDAATWILDGHTPFTRFDSVGFAVAYEFTGTLAQLKEALASVTVSAEAGSPEIEFAWDGGILALYDAIPGTAYLKNGDGGVIGAVRIFPGEFTLTAEDLEEYDGDTPIETVRIIFSYDGRRLDLLVDGSTVPFEGIVDGETKQFEFAGPAPEGV